MNTFKKIMFSMLRAFRDELSMAVHQQTEIIDLQHD